MTPHDMRVAVAKVLGWRCWRWKSDNVIRSTPGAVITAAAFEYVEWPDSVGLDTLAITPDWPRDLNACARFEKLLTREMANAYQEHLLDIVRRDAPSLGDCQDRGASSAERWSWHASAQQRCEALLRTRGVWPGPPLSDYNDPNSPLTYEPARQ